MATPQEFINQEFQKRREKNPNYSLRAFAKWLQISPAQLSQMMTGKRTITLKTFKKLSDRIGVSPVRNLEFVESLLKEKNLIAPTAIKNSALMDEDKFRLMSDWYHMAILTLTRVKGAKADPRWIARRLAISVEEAHAALLRLERMQIIQTRPQFKQIAEFFEVVSDVPSTTIRKYHKQNLAIAAEKIETVEVLKRQFQSISVPTDPSVVAALKVEMDAFLNRAAAICESAEPTEVYNLNVQFFPVTQIDSEAEG